MNGAELVLECLKKEGVDTLFGYPGGAVIPLYDALYDYKKDFLHIRTSHEQGLVHAADGYARSTGKTGVCITTSGPGATNAITGIATAYMDSTPMVIITGQVPTSMLGKDSFQEIDITGMTLSVTKHSYLLRDTKDIVPTIKEAFKIAQSGRKGPVLIDIPKNLFVEEIDFEPFQNLKEEIAEEFVEKTEETDVDELVELIRESKRPVIYAGGGIKTQDSINELVEFAKKMDIPVLNTLMGLGSIDRNEELSLGLMGMHGFREANFAISKADLVIAIGTRFSDRGTGVCSAFAANAKIVHIEIDKSELGKNITPYLKVLGYSREVLKKLVETMEPMEHSEWRDEINSYKNTDKLDENLFHPQNILRVANEVLEDKNGTIVTTDVGQHQMWTAQHWKFKQGRNFVTSGGLGTMGFGLGAAIGSAVGNPNKRVVLVTGDGSFRMNLNELATVRDYNLPIVILLFNNHSLGMVRQWQKLFSNERYSETDISFNIDYLKLCESFSIKSYEVENLNELQRILKEADTNEPLFVQCNIDKDFDVYPIVPPNEVLENLIIG
ncbi:biosynthetic-type acetolactate synthase large subunit [Peptoniphilus indolicus]|uniref:Acetolactate synthase n=2 Tax=Peptoniphilus indolicus TaxID=33030 RepID=G4D4D3_9FIRM|nr:biosynthetic-type acetolactate synthase large subunit [Peptoniphilus indolicus]EGY79617.1 acetolactate synthase large subunit [Peptoniphilus indolicus ATCC 29427]SUB75947.1 Acetolactate synthase large subunit [Peptoniphilus indolicus]